jgi:3',5'-cyclic-AMP phosphodiesterase
LKKNFIKVLLIILCILTYLPRTAFAIIENNTVEPKLQIPVISDIHICNAETKRKFTKVLKNYRVLAPKYKAIAIVGDITDCGLEQEYDSFNFILNQNINVGAEKVITMGNHEYFEGRFHRKPEHTDELFKNRFVNKTHMPGIYYDKWVSGYHFISLGGEKSNVSDATVGDKAIISEEQYQWLEKTIAYEADVKKPIFIFLHQPIDFTVYGSDKWGGLGDGRLLNLLKQYPQVILFSGHSHYPLTHEKTLYQDKFNMVNTGAIHYIMKENDSILAEDMQGLLVNVYEDKVEIKVRDFAKDLWISSYNIEYPTK